ncbi:MAG: glycosyltransferase family 2 protein [Rhodospirillales bacterium]
MTAAATARRKSPGRHGARVVQVKEKGYGAALLGGIQAARGTYVIMADADDSYDFAHLDGFVAKLRQGCELVMGNRFLGGIKPGAMPPLHRYLGNPVLTGIGRLFFKSPSGDFHCGLRGFSKQAIDRLELQTTGMEFASEMVVKATLHGPAHRGSADHPVAGWQEPPSAPAQLARRLAAPALPADFQPALAVPVPRPLHDFAGRIADGVDRARNPVFFRHWPRHSHPGLRLRADFRRLADHPVRAVYQGARGEPQAAAAGPAARPHVALLDRMLHSASLERGLVLGVLLLAGGVAGTVYAVSHWYNAAFGPQQPQELMRLIVPAVTALTCGAQIIFASFFLSVLRLGHVPSSAADGDD